MSVTESIYTPGRFGYYPPKIRSKEDLVDIHTKEVRKAVLLVLTANDLANWSSSKLETWIADAVSQDLTLVEIRQYVQAACEVKLECINDYPDEIRPIVSAIRLATCVGSEK